MGSLSGNDIWYKETRGHEVGAVCLHCATSTFPRPSHNVEAEAAKRYIYAGRGICGHVSELWIAVMVQ